MTEPSTITILWQSFNKLTAYLPLFNSKLIGAVPPSGGGTTNFLRADGTWAAPGGSGSVSGPGSSTAHDLAGFADATGALLEDVSWTTATSKLNAVTSSLQGVAPASGGGTANFLRADGTWAAPPGTASGLVYLNTITASNSADIHDQASFGGSYRSFLLVLRNIVPVTNAVQLELQVSAAGAFKTTTYLGSVTINNAGTLTGESSTVCVPLTGINTPMSNTAAFGYSGEIEVSNMSSTSLSKIWHGRGGHQVGTNQWATTEYSGLWNATSALDGFRILASSGNLSTGSVDIYGIV